MSVIYCGGVESSVRDEDGVSWDLKKQMVVEESPDSRYWKVGRLNLVELCKKSQRALPWSGECVCMYKHKATVTL